MADLSIFDISATGMAVERMRMQIGSVNIANANSTRTQDGELYKPLAVLSSPKYANSFDAVLSAQFPDGAVPEGVRIDSVEQMNLAPRVVYEPAHPDADQKGFVR